MGFVLDSSDPTTPRPGIVCDAPDCGNLVDGDGLVFSVAFFGTHLACSEACLPAIVAHFGDEYRAPHMDRWNKPVRLRDYLHLLTTPGGLSLRVSCCGRSPVATLILYTQTGCADSVRVRSWLTQHGLAFEERDVTTDLAAAEALAATGRFVTPLLVHGEHTIVGYQPEALTAVVSPDTDQPS